MLVDDEFGDYTTLHILGIVILRGIPKETTRISWNVQADFVRLDQSVKSFTRRFICVATKIVDVWGIPVEVLELKGLNSCRFPARHGGTPKWLVYFMENPTKMDDLGVFSYPYFRKPPYGIMPKWMDPNLVLRSAFLPFDVPKSKQ